MLVKWVTGVYLWDISCQTKDLSWCHLYRHWWHRYRQCRQSWHYDDSHFWVLLYLYFTTVTLQTPPTTKRSYGARRIIAHRVMNLTLLPLLQLPLPPPLRQLQQPSHSVYLVMRGTKLNNISYYPWYFHDMKMLKFITNAWKIWSDIDFVVQI